jgi:hypothetical protein
MADQKAVTARLIIEMLGSPKEHVHNTMKKYLDKIKKEGLQLANENVAEPVQKGELYATHSQFDATFPDIDHLLAFCFDAMPSSVEILTPDVLILDSTSFEDFLNDLQARLHNADYELKKIRAENKVLDRNALAVFRNFILHCAKTGIKTKETMAGAVGVPPETLTPFLDALVKEKKILKDNDTYRVA